MPLSAPKSGTGCTLISRCLNMVLVRRSQNVFTLCVLGRINGSQQKYVCPSNHCIICMSFDTFSCSINIHNQRFLWGRRWVEGGILSNNKIIFTNYIQWKIFPLKISSFNSTKKQQKKYNQYVLTQNQYLDKKKEKKNIS